MIRKKVVNGLHYAKDGDGNILEMTAIEALMLGIRTVLEVADKIPWADAYTPSIKVHPDYYEIAYTIRRVQND